MKEKKYKLTDESIEYDRHTLHRIEALKDFGNVKKGDFGGWIEKEENLSQEGNCWVGENAKVFDNAQVYENAEINGDAIIFGEAWIFGNAKIYDKAIVFGNACIWENAKIYDGAYIGEISEIYGEAEVYENAEIGGNSEIYDNAKVYGNAKIYINTVIAGDAEVSSTEDYIIFKNNWGSGRYFTWTRSNNMWKVDCFYGTGKQLIKKAYKDSKENGRKYKATVKYVEKINKIEGKNLLRRIINMFKR